MKVILIMLLCSITIMADGVNKPKRKHRPKPKPPVEKLVVIEIARWRTEKPSKPLTQPEIELITSIQPKPTIPKNVIPPLPPEVITTSEVPVIPVVEDKSLSPWWLVLSAAVIPFVIPHGSEHVPMGQPSPPTITPFNVTPTGVPEPTTWGLATIGLLLIVLRARRKGGV